MSQERVKQLLSELRAELAQSEALDEETLDLARRLDVERDVDTDLMTGGADPRVPELEDAIALEARFAATHPVAERIMRELVAVLGRMGI